jgi:hypothetical protein
MRRVVPDGWPTATAPRRCSVPYHAPVELKGCLGVLGLLIGAAATLMIVAALA